MREEGLDVRQHGFSRHSQPKPDWVDGTLGIPKFGFMPHLRNVRSDGRSNIPY